MRASLLRNSRSENLVPDAIFNEADKHFDEKELAMPILAIAGINVWNRLNVAVRQPAGAWRERAEDPGDATRASVGLARVALVFR